MHLHSRALWNFEEIRRAGSIRAAARRLHLSSSALNRQLLELEAEFGRPLFERLSGGLKVTPEGEVLSRHVITMIQDAQRMEGELGSLRSVSQGSVEIATVESLTSDFMPYVLQQMRLQYPAVELTVRTATSSRAAAMVAEGIADLAICFLRHRTQDLKQLVVGRFDLGIAAVSGHPLSNRKAVSFEECLAYPMILPTEELSIFEEIAPLLSVSPDSLKVALRTGSLELIRRLAVQGQGIALVNSFGIERELQDGKLVHVPLTNAATNLGIYTRAQRVLPHAVEVFLNFASAELRRRAEGGLRRA
ncbi:LysR family transcriptional regulator [Paraburkholderia agricolaris]|uniref:LysR family transcriptional regulator n=1 Tax=Paraburkholderia agricolaris TaxID=2152888 RepID=UPI00142F098C|nr:LysR family transcriptional regulator [Paraburkholderia agricolaris]